MKSQELTKFKLQGQAFNSKTILLYVSYNTKIQSKKQFFEIVLHTIRLVLPYLEGRCKKAIATYKKIPDK